MSSPAFEVELRPEPTVRRLVLSVGAVTMLGGLMLVGHLELPPVWRAALACLWLMDCLWSLGALAQGARRVRKIRLDAAGTIVALGPGGRVEALTLLTGSFVLRRIAWLRVAFPDGSRHAELLVAASEECAAWHRLQLVWQQRREAFGHPLRP